MPLAAHRSVCCCLVMSSAWWMPTVACVCLSVSLCLRRFDIEGGSTYWGGVSSNVAFFEDMVKQAKAEGACVCVRSDLKFCAVWSRRDSRECDGVPPGLKIGVYTSDSQWVPIMGGYSGGSEFPLWYAHYDGIPDFDDFSPFNGWKHPARKVRRGHLVWSHSGYLRIPMIVGRLFSNSRTLVPSVVLATTSTGTHQHSRASRYHASITMDAVESPCFLPRAFAGLVLVHVRVLCVWP
jgi:hypothetical protein